MANPEIKKKIESILFSAGKRVPFTEIVRVCAKEGSEDEVKEALSELQSEYAQKDTSLMIVQDGDSWKFTVRDLYLPIMRKLVSQTELSKSMMETLAIIAFKAPILQSAVIKIRTNKAYDHLKELEEAGYITRKPQGRSKLIDLSQKFFEYFDLPQEELKRRFDKVKELEENVQYLEAAVKQRKEELEAKKKEAKSQEESIKQEHAHHADQLNKDIAAHPKIVPDGGVETYDQEDADTANPVKTVTEKLGKLEVIDEPPLPEEAEGGKPWGSLTVVDVEKGANGAEGPGAENADESNAAEVAESSEEFKEKPKKTSKKTADPLFGEDLPQEIKERVDSRVEELLHPEKEVQREKEEAAEEKVAQEESEEKKEVKK